MKRRFKIITTMMLLIVALLGTSVETKASSLGDYTQDNWNVTEIYAGSLYEVKTDLVYLDVGELVITVAPHNYYNMVQRFYSGGYLYSRIDFYEDNGTYAGTINYSDLSSVNNGEVVPFITYYDFSEQTWYDNTVESYNFIVTAYVEATNSNTAELFGTTSINTYEMDNIWLNAFGVGNDNTTFYDMGFNDGVDSVDPINDTDQDGYDDTSYTEGYTNGVSDGYADGYEATEGEEAIIRGAGTLAGAILSFVLFISTEFAIFGVSLLDVIIITIILGAVIFVLKLVF